MDSEAPTSTAPAITDQRPSRPRRRGMQFLLVLARGLALVAGWIYWSERPLRRAAAALSSNDAEFALYQADLYLQTHPDSTRAQSLKARALAKLRRDPETIVEIFDRIGAATSQELHAWAQAYLLQEQWSMASPLLARTAEMTPRDPDVLYELTICRMRLGELDAALDSAQRLSALAGNEARGLVLVGTIHYEKGNRDPALAAFADVLRHEPDAQHLQIPPAEFFLQHGRMLLRAGQPSEALLPLKRSVNEMPTAEGFVLLGNAALQMGEAEKAAQAWQRALLSDPVNQAAREALAQQALQANQPAEALKWLLPVAAQPDLRSSAAYLLQRVYTALQDMAAADQWRAKTESLRASEERLATINNMVSENPTAFWSRVARTHRFAAAGNWRQAELFADQLLHEAPGERLVIELVDAIHRRDKLPSLERIPITQY